jgi:hypothetical protein
MTFWRDVTFKDHASETRFPNHFEKENGKPGFEGVRPVTLALIFSKLFEGFLIDWKSYLLLT